MGSRTLWYLAFDHFDKNNHRVEWSLVTCSLRGLLNKMYVLLTFDKFPVYFKAAYGGYCFDGAGAAEVKCDFIHYYMAPEMK